MIIKNAQFKISAVSPKQYPDDNLPEIVLVGKSNVGKSSFINTMINRKNWLGQVVNLERLDRSIFMTLIKVFTLLIYLDMVIVKCQK